MPLNSPGSASFIYSHGSRESERLLLDRIQQAQKTLGQRSLLTSPLRILVPSGSLRAHVCQAIAERLGPSAGIECSTLFSFARQLAPDRHQGQSPKQVVQLLLARHASQEPSLRKALDGLTDGYRETVGSAQDLLDAGLTAGSAAAVSEALGEEGSRVASYAQVERAQAIVTVAAAVLETCEQEDVSLAQTPLVEARQRVQSGAGENLKGRIIVYGFADATGLAADLIESLVQHLQAIVFFDRTLDPTAEDSLDPSNQFLRRLEERLGATGSDSAASADPASQPRVIDEASDASRRPSALHWFRAPGREAEAFEVAVRVHSLLGAGATAERVGVVTRDPSSYAAAIHRQFDRQALPFSASSSVSFPTPTTRRFSALAELVAQPDGLRIERLLEAFEQPPEGTSGAELRTALFGAGVTTLDQWLAFKTPHRGLETRTRQGFTQHEDGSVFAEKRRLSASVADAAQATARAVAVELKQWPESAGLPEHSSRLLKLAQNLLRWDEDLDTLEEALLNLSLSAPRLQLSRPELGQLLIGLSQSTGLRALGGQGGGVQILDVTEARGRTFDHLFVIGLNHGVFPRTIREDPLFPDSLRSLLSREGHGLLPDLPIKTRGYDEERYLFLQLLSSSPEITLSWLQVDDDGRPQTASPLVETLGFSQLPFMRSAPSEAPLVTSNYAPGAHQTTDSQRRSQFDLAILQALQAKYVGLEPALTRALEESGLRQSASEVTANDLPMTRPETSQMASISSGRMQALEELDVAPGRRLDLGPFYGSLGPPLPGLDPRRGNQLYVTTLEQVSRCPWKAFLSKVLRLVPAPDPLASPPEVEARWVGNVFHRAVDHMIESARALDDNKPERPRQRSLHEALSHPPRVVEWPSKQQVAQHLRRAAQEVLSEDGFLLKNLEHILVDLTLPHLEQLKKIDFDGSRGLQVLGSELTGSAPFENQGTSWDLFFRVDRVDRTLSEKLFTDYKTGRKGPYDDAKKPETQRERLVGSVKQGERLQGFVYLAAAGQAARARYLFVSPHVEAERELVLDGQDPVLNQAFQAATKRALNVWNSGSFFPRLSEPLKDKEPAACDFCELSEACRRRDSGARGRVRSVLGRSDLDGSASSKAEPGAHELEDAWRLWWYGSPPVSHATS